VSRGRFTPDQVERLLRPIKPERVYEANGQSHVAGWDVTAHLTRMFGFGGWEKEILDLAMVCEEHAPSWSKDKKNWFVTYRCTLRLRIFDADRNVVVEIDDVGTGTSPNLPGRGDAHDFAVKNAVTYALKRCAKDLGDQFGLALYAKTKNAVVGMTLVDGPAKGDEPEVNVEGEGSDHEPPEGVDPDTGEITVTVPESVAEEWLTRLNEIADGRTRTAVKNRFGKEFGPPHSVHPDKAPDVGAWVDAELARIAEPADTELTADAF
jgi:hypothetical protein